MYTSSPSSSAGGGGEDDNHVSFHTPESGSVDGDPSTTTPMTTSTSTTSGKKRPASSRYPTADDDDVIYAAAAAADEHNSSVGGLLNWIGSAVKSITKRSRTSLDMTSVSAIKNANRTPSSFSQGGARGEGEALDDDNAEGNNSVDGSGTKLSKLNLNMKFDHTGGAATAAGHGVGGGGILRNAGRYQQQQHHQQQQQVVEGEWQPVANAIEGGNNTTNIGLWQQNKAAAASMPPPAKKTSFASSPYNAYAGLPDTADADTSTKMSNTHTPPGLLFNMGSNNVNIDNERKMSPIRSPIRQPIKSIQGRKATPGVSSTALSSQRRQQHQQQQRQTFMAGSTPGSTTRTMGGSDYGGNSAQFSSGTRSFAGRGPTTMRRTGGTTAYRRRKINQYKPMSRLLTSAYNPPVSSTHGNGGGRRTDLIVEQILAENRRKMMDATFLVSSSSNGNTAERGLFGGRVVSTTPERHVARTFQEEEAMMMANNRETASTAAAAEGVGVPVVTRVRMNRIYGTGQTGGLQTFPSSATISTQNDSYFASSTNTIGASTSMMLGSMNNTTTTTAPPAAKKRAVTFEPQTTSSNVAMDDTSNIADTTTTTKTLAPVISSYGFQFTPCKSEISMEEGRRIDELLHSAEFYRQAACDSQGYDEPIVTTPCKSGKKAKTARGTPHPRKVAIEMSTPALLKKADSILANALNSYEGGDLGVKSVGGGGGGGINATPGGAPFSFMSGGAAASSIVSTPLAYKYANAKSAIATPTVKPLVSQPASVSQSAIGAPTTAVTAVAPPTQTMGFGNMFALKPGEWKCNICTTKNPKEAAQKCLSCEAAKPGANSLVDNINTGTNSSTKPSVGTIGTGGLSFGGPPSSTLTRPSTHSKSSVSFGVGATPAKAKLDLNDENKKETPASIGAGGFSFGTAASTTSAISSLGNGNALSASGGFSFGGPTSTSANTPAKPKASGESTIKSSIGFKFGTLTEEKKVESVSINTASNGFSFGAIDKGGFSFAIPPPVANAADKRDEGNVSEPVSKKRTTFAFGTTGGSESSPLVSRDTISVPPSTPGLSSSNSSGFALGAPQPASVSATPVPHFTFGAAPTPATEAETKNVAHASTSKSLFNFGVAMPAPASKPDGANATTPAAPFAFGSSTSQTPSISGGAAFSFGAGATPSSFTPAPTAPPANPQPSTTPGFAFAAGSTPAFGSMPGGFGNSSQPAVATPAPTAMAAPFPFGAGVTPAAPSTGGFGGAATSFGFNSTPAPINTPATFGFPVATPNPGQGFAAGAPSFNSTPSFMGSAATPSTNGGGAGAFSIGTGGAKKTPGRRIVKAKRPTPGGGR